MAIRDFLPSFSRELVSVEARSSQTLDAEQRKALAKGFKVSALALGYNGYPASLNKRANFEDPPYDFDKITNAVDTDSYAKAAFAKFRELFWKEGWTIVGENPEAIDYLYERMDYMEIAMGRPFRDFLSDIVDQLIRYHNVFVVKSRSKVIDEEFPEDLEGEEIKGPLIGYYLIPTESVQILRDKFNRPKWYRQGVSANSGTLSASNGTTSRKTDPTWNSKSVIHLYRDKKPGRAFGTPFLTAVLDDLIALRQVEEDYLNLIHRELFPLYKYIIGTEQHPAEPEEITKAVNELEDLRTEGGLVLPYRHDVDIVGSEGKTLEISGFLSHMKSRVAIGLGVFPHHLGMIETGANKDMTDRLDVALYDRVKEYQRYFADCIRMRIFDEILREGGFDPVANPSREGVSDRCLMKFNEIDIDTQVKKETHSIQKVTSNLETVDEGRRDIGREPGMDDADTMAALQARVTPDQVITPTGADGGKASPKSVDTTPSAAQKPSSGGAPNQPNVKKAAANMIRPRNQFGTRTSPNIRRDDNNDMFYEIADLISDKEEDEFDV